MMSVIESQGDASINEIARLMDLADTEDAVIERLEGCVARIKEVQAAKSSLRAFTPSELEEALELRRQRAEELAW